MKQQQTVKLAGSFEAGALRVLRGIPGLTVDVEPGFHDRGVDAVLSFAGGHERVAVQFKKHANSATAWQLVQLAQAQPDVALLLIADETTVQTREILEEHGIGVVDGLGNAHIELPGLLVHLEG
ncbi:MAG TPA: restriction endonuclease, partial [Acidimicrobiales bacterium]|nr:restriction endonuclease [Acidimicrobiales bacterium]